jgi:hypothetical protein
MSKSVIKTLFYKAFGYKAVFLLGVLPSFSRGESIQRRRCCLSHQEDLCTTTSATKAPQLVIPAQTGIQGDSSKTRGGRRCSFSMMDSRLRGNDERAVVHRSPSALSSGERWCGSLFSAISRDQTQRRKCFQRQPQHASRSQYDRRLAAPRRSRHLALVEVRHLTCRRPTYRTQHRR